MFTEEHGVKLSIKARYKQGTINQQINLINAIFITSTTNIALQKTS